MSVSAIVARLYGSSFLRFGFVGGLGFFVNEAALVIAQRGLHAGPHLAWFLAFAPSVVFTWWGNRTITFADRASRTLRGAGAECLRFIATNSFGALANFAVYSLLVSFAPFPLNIPYLALAAGVLVGMVFNFLLSKKIVFKQ